MLFAADVEPDPNSGAAGTELQTIRALREQGHQVDEIWAHDIGRRIRHGNLHYLLELPYRYRKILAQRCAAHSYDVLHVNQGHCYLAARAHKQAKRQGVFVCRSHGLDDHMEKVLSPWRKRLEITHSSGPKSWATSALNRALARHDRLAYRWADGIIVSASHDAHYLKESMGVPPERIGVIPQAPAQTFTDTAPLSMHAGRAFRLLHVGGFAYWKGVHAVGEAASILLARHSEASLTWVCRDQEHSQVEQLIDRSVRDRVEIRSWTTQQQLRDTYDVHGIFLCPSLFDGFGKVFLEAMSRGLCVVGTRTGGMPDVITDRRNGVLVDFHAPWEIVRRVEELWSQQDRLSAMSADAAATARQYSWQRVARETAAFYESLTQVKRAQTTTC